MFVSKIGFSFQSIPFLSAESIFLAINFSVQAIISHFYNEKSILYRRKVMLKNDRINST